MARIAEAEIERLKSEVSLVELVKRRGVKLARVGSNLVGLCPFHDDKKTPNLVVTPEKQVWHCFVCQVGGSVIDWVMKTEGVKFREAVEKLRGDIATEDTTRPVAQPKARQRKSAEPLADPGGEPAALLGRVVAHYQKTMKEQPEGLAYLASRGLDNAEMVEHFQIGLANRTLNHLVPTAETRKGAKLRDQLETLGIFKTSGHEAMRGCVVIPLHDEAGRVVQLYGRRLGNPQRGQPMHLYLAGEHRGVFNREGIKGNEEVILCEAVIDALTFWCAGYRNVTTAYGIEGFTEEIQQALVAAGVKRVKIAFDRDDAGDRGAAKVAAKLEALGIETYRVQFPRGMDANEYAQKMSPAGQSLGLVLRLAQWMGRGQNADQREQIAEQHVAADGLQFGRAIALPHSSPPLNTFVRQNVERAEAADVIERDVEREHVESQAAELDSAAEEGEREEASSLDARHEEAPSEFVDEPTNVTAEKTSTDEAPASTTLPEREAPRDARPRTQEPRGEQDIPLLAALPREDPWATRLPPAPRPSTAREPAPPASVSAVPTNVMAMLSSSPAATVVKEGEDLTVAFRESARKWRVRPWGKPVPGELKVNLMVTREGKEAGFFVDTIDLYAARQRVAFTKQMAEEFRAPEDALRRELASIVLEVEKAREESRRAVEAEKAKVLPAAMTPEERDEAMALLKDPRLLDRILEDLARAGVVGEESNKLVAYLAATSRKLDEPLAIVIQSSSAAGKSRLMEAVLALMPDEERVQYSAMTGQSLFYMNGQDLKHKILAIVEEEGAERASYALKLLQSEGELTIASTGKDPTTGRHVTLTYKVEGPVMIFLTTTASDVDEELLNRCLVLAVDEGREQTQAIHIRQRRSQTLHGRIEREDRQRVRRLHKNVQRLLEPRLVVNPLAMDLKFPSHATRTRRDHMKYLTLISAVTLLHQYQRPVKTTVHRGERLEYIETTQEDVEIATRLARGVLDRSLDELTPQTRRLLELLVIMVNERAKQDGVSRADVRFTRRQIREWTKWGQTQLKLHLDRLEEHEYVVTHRFGRSTRLHQYELLAGDEVVAAGGGGAVTELQYLPEPGTGVRSTSSGVEGTSSGGHRANIGPLSPHYRGGADEDLSSKKAPERTFARIGENHGTPEAAGLAETKQGLFQGVRPTSSGVEGTSSGGHRANIAPLSPHYRGGADEDLSGKKASKRTSSLNGRNHSTPDGSPLAPPPGNPS